MTTCPICFDSLLKVEKASPDVCDHIFCLKCLTQWTKHASYCPIDRKRFKKIIDLDSETEIQIKRRKRKNAQTLYDVSIYCEICKTTDNGDTLLLCDCCDLGYHCECLTPPLKSVPSGQWSCPTCVSVERKLRTRKGDKKLLKPVLKDEEPMKNSRTKPGPSRWFSRSLKSSTSVSDASVSDSKVPSIENSSNVIEHPKIADTFSRKTTFSNNNVPVTPPKRQEIIIVSNADYQILNCCERNPYLSSDVIISPKPRKSRNAQSTSKLFNVFKESDSASTSKSQFSTRLSELKEGPSNLKKHFSKHQRGNETSASKSQGTLKQHSFVSPPRKKLCSSDSDFSEASCNAFYTQSTSEDCSTSSNLSETEKQDLNQQLGQLELNTKVCDSKIRSVNSTNESETKTSESTHLSSPIELSANYFKPNSVHNFVELSECKRASEEQNNLLNVRELLAGDSQLTQESEQHSKASMAKSSHPGLIELKFDDTIRISNHQSGQQEINNKELESNSHSNEMAQHQSFQQETNIDNSELLVNPLLDFEARNAHYALKAKANLQRELQKMEQEKWKSWNPPKRLRHKLFTQRFGENLLDFPKRKILSVEKTTNSDYAVSKSNVFNVDEYKEKVRNGSWHPENIVIVERHRSSHSHCLQNHRTEEMGSISYFNVFKVPDSQSDIVSTDKSQVYITSFNPSQNQSDSKICNTFEKSILESALSVNLEILSAHQDGSLYLNWNKSKS